MTERTSWTAIVPVKDFRLAKSRLHQAPVPTDRLAQAFLEDMLAALSAASGIDQVLVATHDPDVQAVADAAGARCVDDRGHPGINAAAQHAAELRSPGTGIAVLVSDLPSLTGQAVDLVLGLAVHHPTSFVPDLEGTGTTMWLCPRGAGFPSHFGVDSRRRHTEAGAVDLVQTHPGAAEALRPARIDVDTEDALQCATVLGIGRHTSVALSAPST